MKFASILSVAVIFASTGQLFAVTTYNDRGDFESVATGLTYEGFESPFTSSSSLTFPGLTVTTDSGLIERETSSRFVSEGSYALGTHSSPNNTTFYFDDTIYSFGIDLIDFSTVGTGDMSVANNTGTLSMTIATAPPDLGTGNLIFFGVIDPAGFNSITVSRNTSGDVMSFDNLAYAVPEPSSITLGLMSILGLAGFVRRRRK